MSTNICPVCKTTNRPGAGFCRGCGRKLPSKPGKPIPSPRGAAPVQCPKCKTQNRVKSKYCVACGFSLIYSTNKFMYLAHGTSLVIAGYMFYLFSYLIGLPFLLSFILSIIITSCIGFGIYRLLILPLQKKKAWSYAGVPSFGRNGGTLQDIRNTYGSTQFKRRQRQEEEAAALPA